MFGTKSPSGVLAVALQFGLDGNKRVLASFHKVSRLTFLAYQYNWGSLALIKAFH